MTTNQLPTNQEDREVYLREHNSDEFVKAVTEAPAQGVDTVITTVKAFAGEPEVLYVALEYAYHSGMTVTMAPPANERGEPRS
jgi:late competence protein required for DNA uptake (superfamily II DNA/RNA helicase)